MKKNELYDSRIWESLRKIIIAMKLSVFIILLSAFQLFAGIGQAQQQRLTLDFEKSTVVDVLSHIEQESDYAFLYNIDLIDVERSVSLKLKDAPIDKVLSKLFNESGVKYRIMENQIVILSPSETVLQQKENTVSGNVTDSDGQPLPGVSIVIKGTMSGTITDFDGNFSLADVSGDATLLFSFVGMLSQEFVVGSQSTINVTMVADAIGIEEVVAIGYGVQKKKLLTGSTIQVKGEDIQRMNTVSPITALQNKVAGVSIIKRSGEPGAGFKVNIRGIGTTGNSQPLYIVDGVSRGNIDYLNPADIETIDILKDAASAAIYGARASNGVVLVTTKKGKPGKAMISYNGYYGIQNVYKRLPLLNAKEYAVLQNEAQVNAGLRPYDFAEWLAPGDWDRIQNGTWNGTNWLEAMENKDAPIQNHTLNISGGSEKSIYSIGLSYTDQEGIYGYPVQSEYSRYTLRVNTEHVLYSKGELDIIKFGENLSFTYTDRHGIGTGNMWWNDINNAIKTSPFLPLYGRDENGNDIVGEYHYAIPWDLNDGNPVGAMEYTRGYNGTKSNRLNANVFTTIQPIRGLIFRSSFGFSQATSSFRSYQPVYSLSNYSRRTEDITNQNMNVRYSWVFENTATYDFSIGGMHNINIMAGTSAEKSGLGEDLAVTNLNNQFDDYEHAYIANANNTQDGTASISGSPHREYILQSYFGRVNYDYKETYMATVVMRADGSSNFAPGHRWGYFPSASAGWVVSNEPFMKSLASTMGFLKLRASWGQNGNQSIPPFQYMSLISFNSPTSPANYYFGEGKASPSSGAYPSNLPTTDLTWETSEQLDIGIDARFFNNKLGVAADWYYKQTKDWLVPAPILASWGVSTAPYINGGDISNKGVELSLDWKNNSGDFHYSINANIGYNKNEVTRIDNSQGIIDAASVKLWGNGPTVARAQVGFPIGYFWGFKTAGIFQNEQQVLDYKNSQGTVISPASVPGDVIFVDINDDGVIDDKDKGMIGDPNPDVIFSLGFNCSYKGFDLSVATNGVAGNQIARKWRDSSSPLGNYVAEDLSRWHGEGTSNRIPRVQNGASINTQYTSQLDIEDGDYWRISNITLGYDFNKHLKFASFQEFRLYLTAQNIFTFTGYSGMDPEIGTSTNDNGVGWANGVDIGFYPSPRTYMVGFSVKF